MVYSPKQIQRSNFLAQNLPIRAILVLVITGRNLAHIGFSTGMAMGTFVTCGALWSWCRSSHSTTWGFLWKRIEIFWPTILLFWTLIHLFWTLIRLSRDTCFSNFPPPKAGEPGTVVAGDLSTWVVAAARGVVISGGGLETSPTLLRLWSKRSFCSESFSTGYFAWPGMNWPASFDSWTTCPTGSPVLPKLGLLQRHHHYVLIYMCMLDPSYIVL